MRPVKQIALLAEHRVRTGETLESVAGEHGLTWEQLAKFNWDTTDPHQVNNHLRTDVGATRRSQDDRFFVFDDADDPGIILVPSEFRETGLETNRTHTVRVTCKQIEPNLITCCRIPGTTFAYDSSFVHPTVVHSLKRLEDALEEHPDARIMIFGHTDRCGPPLYNKKLSDRRAQSVYAFITNQPDIWEDLYQEERWGDAALRSILADLGFDPGSSADGADPGMDSAVRAYQGSKPELPANGDAGPETRRAMFLDYMTGVHDIRVTQEQFVEPRFMGCGEFNPTVGPNDHELANGGRGERPGNLPNRRVVFYLFRRAPRDIPCRLGAIERCRREIARDADQRTNRHPLPTFACSFYDRIAAHCRCECAPAPAQDPPGDGTLVVRVRNEDREAVSGARVTIRGQEENWTTNESGRVHIPLPASESYVVVTRADGYLRSSARSREVVADQETRYFVRLRRPGSDAPPEIETGRLIVSVRTSGREPLEGVLVSLEHDGEIVESGLSVRSNDSGPAQVIFDDLDVGYYVAHGELDNHHSSSSEPIAVTATEAATATLSLAQQQPAARWKTITFQIPSSDLYTVGLGVFYRVIEGQFSAEIDRTQYNWFLKAWMGGVGIPTKSVSWGVGSMSTNLISESFNPEQVHPAAGPGSWGRRNIRLETGATDLTLIIYNAIPPQRGLGGGPWEPFLGRSGRDLRLRFTMTDTLAAERVASVRGFIRYHGTGWSRPPPSSPWFDPPTIA